jgi:replicative DNA helicase
MKIGQSLTIARENIINEREESRPIMGMNTGFNSIEKMIGHLQRGHLIVIAARPSMGKTSFAMNIASNLAKDKKKIAIFSLEMTTQELLLRLISSESGIPTEKMKHGLVTPHDIAEVSDVIGIYSTLEIHIDDNGANTMSDIRAKTRRLKSDIEGLDLVIIDYLQLMSSVKSRDNRQQEISEISRSLKVFAKEMDIPVIVLSQLNRAAENRPNKKPMLADLRESGAIEQDADIVMLIYRDEFYNPDSEEKGKAEIIIAKNRHGATGTVRLKFEKEKTLFADLPDNAYENN